LLISGLLLTFRSCRASLKSAATSAEGIDIMGKSSLQSGQQGNSAMCVRQLVGSARKARLDKSCCAVA
jgi:hypothetical protein